MWSALSASHVLQRKLHMIQPGFLQPAQPRRVKPDRGGDQVGVKPGIARRRDDLDQVAAGGGFAARQMDLQHAHCGRLTEHARPGRGVQFIAPIVQRQRIRAIRAGKRTAMRQLGQQAERRRNLRRGVRQAHTTIRFVASSASISFTSPCDHARDRRCTARRVHRRSAPTVRVPSQRRRISLAGPSVSITRSGPSSTQASRVLSKCSRTPGASRGRSGSCRHRHALRARTRRAGSGRA